MPRAWGHNFLIQSRRELTLGKLIKWRLRWSRDWEMEILEMLDVSGGKNSNRNLVEVFLATLDGRKVAVKTFLPWSGMSRELFIQLVLYKIYTKGMFNLILYKSAEKLKQREAFATIILCEQLAFAFPNRI